MKHAIILAHPRVRSFNGAVAATYAAALRSFGEDVIERDLYRVAFDPCLKAEEIPDEKGYQAAPDVVAERNLLSDVEVFTFVYPLWFNAPPAILKGYVDRIFSMGFGYEPTFGGTQPRLDGRQLLSFTSSGAPDAWVKTTGTLEALEAVLDRHLAAVCGLSVIDHVHFGGVVPDIRADAFDTMLDQVRATARVRFGPAIVGGARLRSAT